MAIQELPAKTGYHDVLNQVKLWSAEQQIRLIQDVAGFLDPGNSKRPEKNANDITVEELRRSLEGTTSPALRKVQAEEAIGTINLRGKSLTLEEEKEAFIEAIMEKYG